MLNLTNVYTKLFIFKQITLEATLSKIGGMLLIVFFYTSEISCNITSFAANFI